MLTPFSVARRVPGEHDVVIDITYCGVCHTAEKGAANKIGPNLFGVVGRKSATAPGYMYSPAMMKAALTWDVPTLQVYLMGPQKKVPGTKMGFPGFSDPQDEADAIAYLVTLK